jgi:hypothetical protein
MCGGVFFIVRAVYVHLLRAKKECGLKYRFFLRQTQYAKEKTINVLCKQNYVNNNSKHDKVNAIQYAKKEKIYTALQWLQFKNRAFFGFCTEVTQRA